MKNQFSRFGSLVVALVILAGFLLATSPLVSGESAGVTEPEDSEKKTQREDRLKQRRDQFKIVLGIEAKKRLATKCVAAQKAVGTIKTRDGTIREKRHGIYTKMIERLNEVTLKLQQQGQSTANLQEAQTSLTDAVNKYLADAETYRATINDLAEMACSDDVESWQATLQAAREQREQLKTDTAEIKAALASVRQALQVAKQALSTEGTN